VRTLHIGSLREKPEAVSSWTSWPLPARFNYAPALKIDCDAESLQRAHAFITEGKRATCVDLSINLDELPELSALNAISPVRTPTGHGLCTRFRVQSLAPAWTGILTALCAVRQECAHIRKGRGCAAA
jgi:hypothetical protein